MVRGNQTMEDKKPCFIDSTAGLPPPAAEPNVPAISIISGHGSNDCV